MTAFPDAGDPGAEMVAFHQQVGATSEPEGQQPPAAPATPAQPETPATPQRTWQDEIVDREDLPPSLRGIPVKDYIDRTSRLAAEVNQRGYEKNEALARAQVAEATARVLEQRLAAAQQAVLPQPPPPQPHEAFGLQSPDDVYREGVLPQVLSRIDQRFGSIPQLIDQRVAEAVSQVRENEIAPLIQNNVAMRMEQAQAQAMESAKLDQATFLAVRPALASYVHANGWNPETPQSWLAALDMHRQAAAKLVPQQVSVSPGAPPMGNARPGATAAPAVRRPATSGNKHIDAEVKRQVALWDSKGIKVSAEDIMEDLRQNAAFGGDE